MQTSDPAAHLPLTPLWFNILLTLADGDNHGYAIIQDIEERSGGRDVPATGTVYLALQRLLEEGMIAETEAAPVPEKTRGPRTRRVYALTPFGRSVARLEAERIAEQLRVAIDRRIARADSGGA